MEHALMGPLHEYIRQ